MDWFRSHKRSICYCLVLGGIIASFWFLKFGLIETLLPIILGVALYYRIPRRYIFYLGAFSLLSASVFLAFRQIDFASELSIVAYFSFITILIQTVILNRSKWQLCFPNGLMFLRNNFNKFLPVVLLIVIVFFAASSLIRTDGDIFAGDFNFPLNYENYLQEHLHLWNEHGSWSQPEVANHTIFLAPFFFVSSVFSLSMVALNKLILVVLLLIAALGTFFFTRKLLTLLNCRSLVTASILPFVAAVFYAFNPWIMGRLGHYFLAVGYALLPVIVLAFIYALNTRKLHYVVLTALLFAAAGTVPHNILYIGFALLIVFLVWLLAGWRNYHAGVFRKYLLPALGVAALFILFSMVWILPTFISTQLTGGAALSPGYMVRIDDIKNAYQDSSFSDIFLSANKDLAQNIPWKSAGLLLVIFVPLGFCLNIKKPISWVMMFIFIGASIIPVLFLEFPQQYFDIFFSKTSEWSLGWLVRDPTRTVILIPFCVTLGLVLTITALEKILIRPRTLTIGRISPAFVKYRHYLLWLVLDVVIVLVVFYNWPLTRDSLEKSHLPLLVPGDYWQVGKQLEQNADQNSRVVWYPGQIGSNEFAWSKNMQVNNFVDRSFEVRTLGTNSAGGRQFSLLLNSAIKDQNPYLGELLDSYNIDHLVYRQELVDEKDVDISAQKSYLETAEGMNLEFEAGGLSVFAHKNKTLPLTVGRRTYLVIGDSDAMGKLAGLDSVNLADDLLIFLDQEKYNPEVVTSLIHSTDGIIFNDAGSLDFITTLLDNQYFIYPIDFTNRGDYRKHWSGASVNDPLHGEWHEMLANDFKMSSFDFDYNHGLAYIYTEKPEAGGDYYKPSLELPVSIAEDDNYTILIRSFNNPRAEAFQFSLGDFTTTLDTFSNSAGFSWRSIFTGDLKAGSYNLKLTNIAGLNAVSTISIVPTSKLAAAESQAFEFQKNKVAYLYTLGYQNLFDQRQISNPTQTPLLYGLSLKNMNNYTNQFYINRTDLDISDFTKNDGVFSISNQPQATPRDSVFSINSLAIASYHNLVNALYTPEPESVGFEVIDKFSAAVDVKTEGSSKHRRVMTKAIPVKAGSPYFISFSAQYINVDILSGVVRQYEEADSTVPIRSDKLEMASPPNSPGEKKFAKFFDVSPKAKFIKLEISTKNAIAGSFRIGDLQLFAEEAINKATGAFIAFTPDMFSAESTPTPDLSVTKRGPEKYLVQVTGATKPFILKFAETYNPLWQAKIDGELMSQLNADGAFNAYLIDKTGDYIIEIEFAPQKWMIIGLLITAGNISFMLLLAYYFHRKKIRLGYEKNR